MYKLSVGAIFKNEAHSIKEWLEHYLYHGAEHFFLINDSSTDNFLEIIQPYIDAGLITLFNPPNWSYYLGRQRGMYNHYILETDHFHETKWLLIVDLDEYVWSKDTININDILDNYGNASQLQIKEVLFGSNGHIEQPNNIVESFTKRKNYESFNGSKSTKYFVNTAFNFISLNVHTAAYGENEGKEENWTPISNLEYNHYSCQSLQFWNEIKCTRGDGDSCRTRTEADFAFIDINEVEDMGLYEQNKNIVPRF